MRFIGLAFVFALLSTAPLASAQKASGITPYSIAGIHLGVSKPVALKLMTKPLRHDLLEDGYERYVSPKQKVEVYFRTGTKGVAVVTTWNRQLQTGANIGPCTTIAALKQAYRSRLNAVQQGLGTRAYRLGNLFFTVNGKRVGAVGLGRGDGGAYVTLNVAPCR
jgi:hypothetical protein